MTEINTPNTTLTSPKYPMDYPSNQECRALVRFPQGQRVSLHFLKFNLEGYSDCFADWLEVRDGDDATSNVIGKKLCGSKLPSPIISSGNTMFIHFHTDSSLEYSGFKFRIATALNASNGEKLEHWFFKTYIYW